MPSLFSGAIDSQRNLVGLIWSGIMLTAGISLVSVFIHNHIIQTRYANYSKLGGYDYSVLDDAYYKDEDEENNSGSEDGEKDIYYLYYLLSSVQSTPLFVSSIYTTALVGLISIYGSTYVVGFVGPDGKYIKPLFGSGSSTAPLHYGFFVGILFVFGNLSFVCSLIFSDVWVLDFMEGGDKENMPSYAVESFARSFCYLFLIFAFIYSAFAIIVLSFRESILDRDADVEIAERPQFITRKETPSF